MRYEIQMNIALADCNFDSNSSFTNHTKCYYFCDNTTTDKQTHKCYHSRVHASLHEVSKSPTFCCVFFKYFSAREIYDTI